MIGLQCVILGNVRGINIITGAIKPIIAWKK